MRKILVPADGTDASRPVVELAFAAARTLGAHVEVLHVRPDARDAVPLLGEGMSGAMVEELIELTKKEAGIRAKRAADMFASITATAGVPRVETPTGSGVSASYQQQIGREDETMAWYGRLADLVVVGQPQPRAEGPSTMLLHAAVFETGRPVMVAPPVPATDVGRVVAIAWNGSAEAARAVAAGMAFIRAAERVVVMTMTTDKTPEAAAEQLAAYLAWHGVTAEKRVLDPAKGPVGAAVLTGCADAGADLLVMGAYTHSRMMQLILGGVTRHVLHEAALPVLMAH